MCIELRKIENLNYFANSSHDFTKLILPDCFVILPSIDYQSNFARSNSNTFMAR